MPWQRRPPSHQRRGLTAACVVVAWLQNSCSRAQRQHPQGSLSSGRRGSGTGRGVARPLCCVAREPCDLAEVPTPALGLCG